MMNSSDFTRYVQERLHQHRENVRLLKEGRLPPGEIDWDECRAMVRESQACIREFEGLLERMDVSTTIVYENVPTLPERARTLGSEAYP